MPKVSIIIPTYNRAYCLQQSIQSLLNQTYENFEIIVVDDGSLDNTQTIVKELIKKDPRISYIKHSERSGANVARNTGIHKAKGKFIAFQDSDDYWLPDKLSVQMNNIRSTGIPASFTSFWRIQGKNRIYIPKRGRNIKPGIYSYNKEILEGNFIALPSLVVEKNLLLKIGGFDESLPRLQDWEMLLRLSKVTTFIFLNIPLVKAYVGRDSISKNRVLYRKAIDIIIKKHAKDFNGYPVALAIQYINLAADAVEGKEYKFLFSYILKIVKLGPIPLLKIAIRFFSRAG